MKHPPWLEDLLRQPDVTDICINGIESVFYEDRTGMKKIDLKNSPDQWLHQWSLEMLAQMGKTWNAKDPFVSGTIAPLHRIHISFPPVSRLGILVSIRRLSRPRMRLWNTTPEFKILENAVQQSQSILISGSTGAGKTTLANELLGHVPESERIICLEDTPELEPKHPHFVSLLSRPPNADGFGEISLRKLMVQALRMRPDRIVLGECRGPEVFELLQALNTGHQGSIATIHANSARDALHRIELLCQLSFADNQSIPIPVVRDFIAKGIQWIVQVSRVGGQRRITEVVQTAGKEGNTVLLRPISTNAPC